MSHSACVIYLHFVWATKYRQPTICTTSENALHRIVRTEALRLGCTIVAINGTEDHLHVLAQMNSVTDPARLVNRLKGVSSSFLNEDRRGDDSLNAPSRFRWQTGYGVRSLGPNQIGRVIAYIRDQKQHHASATSKIAWEPRGDCG